MKHAPHLARVASYVKASVDGNYANGFLLASLRHDWLATYTTAWGKLSDWWIKQNHINRKT